MGQTSHGTTYDPFELTNSYQNQLDWRLRDTDAQGNQHLGTLLIKVYLLYELTNSVFFVFSERSGKREFNPKVFSASFWP